MTTYDKSPYKNIPPELRAKYTMNGKISILDWYFDGTRDLHEINWTPEYINTFKSRFTIDNIRAGKEGKTPYGHPSVVHLLSGFLKYNIKNLNVAVLGSTSPWIEAILLNLNNKVTTIEYNVPNSTCKNLVCKDYYTDFQNKNNNYDCIVTYSSIEHSGLGRYGDPLNPNGDVKTMHDIYSNLKENGFLIWGAPVGKDALVWNAHRIYGNIRLPLLFNNFQEIEWIGYTKTTLLNNLRLDKGAPQPVIVLKKK